MKFRFLGGAEEIGRLGLVVSDRGGSLLLDYGMDPGKPPQFPDPAPKVDACLLTHAHLDHSGMLPALAAGQADVDIWASEVSRRVSSLLFRDSIKIADQDGLPRPFQPDDAAHCETRFRDTFAGDVLDIGPFTVRPRLAGHIPGAFQFLIEGGSRSVAFTGDLYTRRTRLVPKAEQVKADILFIETTYAGRKHTNREAEEKRLVDRVTETVERGGTAIIPAFATGRTQEVLLALTEQSDFEIWVDGMGGRVLDIFRDAPRYLHDAAALKTCRARLRFVRQHRQRRHAAKTADVIVATSGMLDGGPVLYYLDQFRRDTRSSVFLTGYQVEGTNGRRLLEERKVRERGVDLDIACEVDKFDLSTHLDHDDIVDYVRKSGCDDVVLYHGYNREALTDDLSPHANVHVPVRGAAFEL